jgi:hypothetical protein
LRFGGRLGLKASITAGQDVAMDKYEKLSREELIRLLSERDGDPPPLKWSALRYGFRAR